MTKIIVKTLLTGTSPAKEPRMADDKMNMIDLLREHAALVKKHRTEPWTGAEIDQGNALKVRIRARAEFLLEYELSEERHNHASDLTKREIRAYTLWEALFSY